MKDLQSLGVTIAKQVHDGVFAQLRKSGALKDQPGTNANPTTDAVTTPSSTPAPVDSRKLRSLDRALTQAGVADKLTDAQHERYEKLFLQESPSDALAWVREVVPGIGNATPAPATGAPPNTNPNPNLPAQPAGPPVSDRGSPAPNQTPPMAVKLTSMDDAGRARFIREKGLGAYTKQLNAELAGVRIKVR